MSPVLSLFEQYRYLEVYAELMEDAEQYKNGTAPINEIDLVYYEDVELEAAKISKSLQDRGGPLIRHILRYNLYSNKQLLQYVEQFTDTMKDYIFARRYFPKVKHYFPRLRHLEELICNNDSTNIMCVIREQKL